jgi:hypothetical protein
MRRLGCALIGALAMIVGVMNFIPVMLAAANSPHGTLAFLGWLALWALLFEAGALFLSQACGIPLVPYKMVTRPGRIPSNPA